MLWRRVATVPVVTSVPSASVSFLNQLFDVLLLRFIVVHDSTYGWRRLPFRKDFTLNVAKVSSKVTHRDWISEGKNEIQEKSVSSIFYPGTHRLALYVVMS